MLGALATVTAAAWAYLLLGAGIETEAMEMGGGRMIAILPRWGPGYAALVSVMWWVMMVAMMLPTAAPTVLLVTSLACIDSPIPIWFPLRRCCLRPAIFSSGAVSVSRPPCCNGVSTMPDCYPRGWRSVMQSYPARS